MAYILVRRCTLACFLAGAMLSRVAQSLAVAKKDSQRHASGAPDITTLPWQTGGSLAPQTLGASQCGLLQAAFLVRPPPQCKFINISSNGSACFCTISLPPSMKNMPAKADPSLQNTPPPDQSVMVAAAESAAPGAPAPAAPVALSATAPATILPPPGVADRATMAAQTPLFPPLKQVTPAVTPMEPYIPPDMPAECPFSKTCANDDCVGYDSWGFSHALINSPTSGSEYLSMMSCMYVMAPGSHFVVPKRVVDYWNLQNRRNDATTAMHYSRPIDLKCEGLYLGNTLKEFCQDMIVQMNTSCTRVWADIVSTRCTHGPPPAGFNLTSSLWQLCPFECELDENNWAQHHHVLLEPIAPATSISSVASSITSWR